jgi:hypothetical protein
MIHRRQVPPPPPPPEAADLEHLQQWTLDLEAWIKVKVRTRVRQAVMRYVLPGLLISGLGIVAVIGLLYRDSQADKGRVCEAATMARENFRTFARGQYDQWDEALDVFPSDSPAVVELRAINDRRRAETEKNYPDPDVDGAVVLPQCR